jgi:hypothetical protein
MSFIDRRDKKAEEEAETDAPLDEREAAAMGSQRPRPLRDIKAEAQTIYGEVDGPETEDQYDAHHADQDEHL